MPRIRIGSVVRLPFVVAAILISASLSESGRAAPAWVYADQGSQWTNATRLQFYWQDQGSRLMPLAWVKALKTPDGKSFLDGGLARYGYLSDAAPPPEADGLPIGFTLADSPQGKTLGMTCAACHTRQITISGKPYRIDGGPAIADFQTMLADLDKASLAVLADTSAFDAFAADVLGRAASETDKALLRAEVTLWSARFHLITSKSLPTTRPWGPARLDAVSMILNRVTGLDIGPAPTYAIPDNIRTADAPARYPFLWNASRQDKTQWPGFAANGEDFLALPRNLGEVYGVFGDFHPELPTGSATLLDRNYVVHNSGNFAGLQKLEDLTKRIGAPAWPGQVDRALADRGQTIYEQVKTGPKNKSCAGCHGIKENTGIDNAGTWHTPIENVGTDQAEWRVLGRFASTGVLEGAQIPEVVLTLQPRDRAISILKISVAGAFAENGVSNVARGFKKSPFGDLFGGMLPRAATLPDGLGQGGSEPLATQAATSAKLDSFIRLPWLRLRELSADAPLPPENSYEARVLHGIWAVAPYLHNGSVPTLADLLKPAAQRPPSFAVGSAYDLATVGLAKDQPDSTFTQHTTGCGADNLQSGDSNCGHEYGTQLSNDDKKALLEYLKVL